MADTCDGEEDNEPSLMLDWATAERIATTDPVVAQLIPEIDAELPPKMLPENPPRSTSLIEREAKHQLNVRGRKYDKEANLGLNLTLDATCQRPDDH